jgi:hypothetical protein
LDVASRSNPERLVDLVANRLKARLEITSARRELVRRVEI